MEPRRVRRSLTLISVALAVGVLLALAASASADSHTPPARRIGPPRVLWSASKIEHGIGEVQLAHGRHRKDQLDELIDLGPAAFDYGIFAGHAVDWVHSLNPNGTPIDTATYLVEAEAPSLAHRVPFPVTGGAAHVDWTQAYDRRRRDANLRFEINHLNLDVIDDNGPHLDPAECPAAARCDSIRAFVRYHLRAWTVAGGHEFFNVGGGVFAEGHQHAWLAGAATSVDSGQPFWTDATFSISPDFEHDGSGSHLVMRLTTPIAVEVPLKKVPRNALFEVHMTLDAVAIDDRGRESAASARIEDPPHAGAGLIAHGLSARAAPPSKEPPVRPRPAARCPGGPRPHAGTLQLSGPLYTVGEANATPLVFVKRVGGSRGATSAVIHTRGGSAVSGRDFRRTRTVVRFENGDASPRLVEIPIREDRAVESPESFKVSLAHVRCAKLGKRRSSEVTILDDDQPPPPPSPTFTIGGTVDGLQGTGLVLSNLGAELPVSANGSFTFPGSATDAQTYEVNVKTQPHNPDQACSVEHGTGHVSTSNVSDIAVHCATIAAPSGLDRTFGSGGRVSTPVGGGEGEAVVIQPGDEIVTAGSRTVGAGTDFALARHDSLGNLDTGFGTNGIATTDLGGAGDQAHDAALLQDGGLIAVGETDAPGIQKQDFALVRYNPDGTPNTSFDTDGVVTTDLSGHGDVANAVAVQPDGKIVVAGFTTGTAGHSDFAVARYNPDGTLDTSFDGDGIVKTDFGALSDDDARALAIQPNGRIVVVGTAGEDVALARYLPDGSLDPTFGSLGVTTTDLGFEDVATGVALTGAGGIVVAGYTIGTKLNNDFLLVRYGPDGDLDRGFGTLGVVKTDFGSGADFAEDLTVDTAGRIVVVGRATSPTIFDMALARYNPDGRLDTAFDGDGILTADFHGAGEFGEDVTLDATGRIIAAGYTANGADTEFALMRAIP